MTESNQVNVVCRRALAPYGSYVRVENRLPPAGHPDVFYSLLGVAGALELKLGQVEGRCPFHLTYDQIVWGRTWTAPPSHGLWHLLVRIERIWLLYDIKGASALQEGHGGAPRVRAEGALPVGRMMKYLAPPEMRRLF